MPENKKKMHHIIKMAVLVLLVLCAGKFLMECRDGEKNSVDNQDVIVFAGHGEVSAVPDIANVDFTIEKDAKTVKEAQAAVAIVEKQALDLFKLNNIAEKDIKTTNSSFYPKYEFVVDTKAGTACTPYGCPPQPGKNVITGYTASESITVKIRNTDDAAKIIEGLGKVGVSNLNGPNFAIDKEDALKGNARKLAIDDAKAKAKILAKDLGVRLGKITSFSENGNYPMPMYNAKAMTADSAGAAAPAVLPKGENLITSDITITYQIK